VAAYSRASIRHLPGFFRFGLLGAALAPTGALVGLALATPACCCGVVPPKPGPPGNISGQVLFSDATPPAAVVVYAVDFLRFSSDGHPIYGMTRLAPPQTDFSLSVPPGLYRVVARLDSDPLSGAGFTFSTACRPTPETCGANYDNHGLDYVRVESRQAVTGINVGDWGTNYSRQLLWDIDTNGSPFDTANAKARTLPARALPPPRLFESTSDFTTRWSGVKLQLPTTWHVVSNPNPYDGNADYYASEPVSSPLQLDAQGIWLMVGWHIERGCPAPDWRFASAKARPAVGGLAEDFYFEDPPASIGTQPFTGYVFHGGRIAHGDCLEFHFTARSAEVLAANLDLIAAILSSAVFGPRSN
jgi:hypothetical protein